MWLTAEIENVSAGKAVNAKTVFRDFGRNIKENFSSMRVFLLLSDEDRRM